MNVVISPPPSPLHHPFSFCRVDPITPLARTLLEAGSDPTACDYFGRAALHYAGISGEVTAAAWIIEALAAREARLGTPLGNCSCADGGGDDSHRLLVEPHTCILAQH
jgi:ankyrin repeat protein